MTNHLDTHNNGFAKIEHAQLHLIYQIICLILHVLLKLGLWFVNYIAKADKNNQPHLLSILPQILELCKQVEKNSPGTVIHKHQYGCGKHKITTQS